MNTERAPMFDALYRAVLVTDQREAIGALTQMVAAILRRHQMGREEALATAQVELMAVAMYMGSDSFDRVTRLYGCPEDLVVAFLYARREMPGEHWDAAMAGMRRVVDQLRGQEARAE